MMCRSMTHREKCQELGMLGCNPSPFIINWYDLESVDLHLQE